MSTFFRISNAFDGGIPIPFGVVNSSSVDEKDIITLGCLSLSYQQGAFRFYVLPLTYACFRGRFPQ